MLMGLCKSRVLLCVLTQGSHHASLARGKHVNSSLQKKKNKKRQLHHMVGVGVVCN